MMKLHLHNTQSGRKEEFQPIDPRRVTMYVCGPTVYGHVHIGNGRPAVVFDVLYRVLEALYPRVVYACNVTDVDDKINRRALANDEPIAALAERYTQAYNDDIAALGVLDTTLQPRATEHITEIVAMIETLIEKGFAYAADGHVLFHVPADPQYGRLSRRSLEDMLDGARVEVAPYKRDPKDFVLWKPSTPELPGWASPWGRGRPGWHIECSAMIRKHLGTHIDIHGGGADLAFPHHENESAQSRCANDSPEYVRYWLHNGMLTMGDEKMSKSLGNIVTINSLRREHAGETLRYALLSGQYRSSLSWSNRLLEQARRSLDALYQALRGGIAQQETASNYREGRAADFPETVLAPLLDDLNTPAALAALHALAGKLNKATDEADAQRHRLSLLRGGWLLGLLQSKPDDWFKRVSSNAPDASVTLDSLTVELHAGTLVGSTEPPLNDGEVERRITERTAARRAKDYAAADRIRDSLAELGIELEDTRQGTLWKRVKRGTGTPIAAEGTLGGVEGRVTTDSANE